MNLIEAFRGYLLNNKSSRITVKNYLSDVNKFIKWYEVNKHDSFNPGTITNEIITDYLSSLIPELKLNNNNRNNINPSSLKSVKRYESSLRKFFNYLKQQGLITNNPLTIIPKAIPADPWLIKDFKNFMYEHKASELTIKNYLLDIKHFLNWAESVTEFDSANAFESIDSNLIEEYKNRLLNQASFSPVSVNRKLSSLRKYISWLKSNSIVKTDTLVSDPLSKSRPDIQTEAEMQIAKEPVTLEQLADIEIPEIEEPEKTYSRFGPFRFFQKNIYIGSLLLDLIITRPAAYLTERANLSIWKLKGEKLFKPIDIILNENNSTDLIPGNTQVDIENVSSSISKTDNKLFSFISFLHISRMQDRISIKNVPKEMYAPLKVSTKNFPLGKKIIYHLRYTRPGWYKKYHRTAMAQYLHFSAIVIFLFLISLSLYNVLFQAPKQRQPALASLVNTSPKFLAFHGKLTDSNNNPITAQTPVRFAIYDDPTASGAAMLWQEVQQVNPDKNGSFNVLLGKYTALSNSLFQNNQSLYLGISIEQDSELLPRQQIAMVSLADDANSVQGLVPITQANAGTRNVLLALDSSGNLTIGNGANTVFQATGGNFTITGQTVNIASNQGSNGDVQLNPDGNGKIDFDKPIQNITDNNNIPSAAGAVEVDDLFAVLATSSGQSAFTINQNGVGPIISASSEGTAKFTLDDTGTGTFANNVAVNGNYLTSTSNFFNLLSTNVQNLAFANAATFLTIGSSNGKTIVNNRLQVNGDTIFGGQSYNWPASESAQTVLENDGSGNLSWVSISSVNGGNWQNGGGFVYPQPINSDLLIGSTSTNSATFALVNVNSGTPTENINGQNGALTLNANGNITTTNNQNLTLGTNGSGNIILSNFSQGVLHTNANGVVSSSPVNLASSDVSGQLPTAAGGTGTNVAFSQGSIVFAGATESYSQNNNALFWDNTNNRLGVGTNAPSTLADLRLSGNSTGDVLTIGNAASPYATLGISSGTPGDFYMNASAGNDLSLGANGTSVIRISGSDNGIVGFNTSNPSATLDVRNLSIVLPTASFIGDTSASGVIIDNSGTGGLFTASSAGITQFSINNQGDTRVGGSLCVKANLNQTCAGNTPGAIYATNTTVQGADYAENYVSSQILTPGEVVALAQDGDDQAVNEATASSSAILGIVSTSPGVLINSGAATDSAHPYIYPIALSGRVPLTVSTQNGPVHAGDPLTASLIPGVATKETGTGEIIGRALEDMNSQDGAQTETIMTFVSLSWYDDSVITDAGNVSIEQQGPASIQGPDTSFILVDNNNNIISDMRAIADAVIANLQAGLINAKEITTGSLAVAGSFTINGTSLQSYIAEVVNEIEGNTQQKQNILSPIADAESISTNIITPTASNSAIGLRFNNNQIAILNGTNASSSAVDTFDNQGNATFSGTLRAQTIIANNIEGFNFPQASPSSTYITNVTNVYNTESSNSAEPVDLSQGNSPSGLEQQTPDTDASASALAENFPNSDGYADIASFSGQLNNTPTLSTDFGQFNQGLISLGATSLSDVSVANQIDINRNMVIDDDSINTLETPLSIQPLRQGDLSIMGGLVAIDTSGNLQVQGNATFAQNVSIKGTLYADSIAPSANHDLSFQTASGSPVFDISQVGDIIASGSGEFEQIAANALHIVHGAQADTSLTDTVASSSAGTAVISANETGRTILTPYVTQNSLIYLTPTSNTQGVTPYIARQTSADPNGNTQGSFTIEIPYVVRQNITLNWWVVN